MAVKVGINGFGRIGRNILRTALNHSSIEFVAVNDLTDAKTLAHLLKYDSVLGNLQEDVSAADNTISIGRKKIKVFAEKDPGNLNWESVGAQIVVESTGRFTEAEGARKHLRGSVKKVIISAPAKNEDLTIVLGVNDCKYDPAKHHIISNASCTTNCLAPLAKVVHDKFTIQSGTMTTIHSYNFHRSCQGPAPRHPRTEGQARWLRHAGADAQRFRCRFGCLHRKEDYGRRGKRRIESR
jgi:glyceraldehyde 3-phosphate dehydrogenase